MNIAESVEFVLREAGYWNETVNTEKQKTSFFGSSKGIGAFTKEDEMNSQK